MARWIKDQSSRDEDIRINLVIKASKDPSIHRTLNQLDFRGGAAQALRALLSLADRSGLLEAVVSTLKSGGDPASLLSGRLSSAADPKADHDVTSELVERIKALNRF